MAFINGLLVLGVQSGNAVVPPPAGVGYAPQPISFDFDSNGNLVNSSAAQFGPPSGPWGTLNVFTLTGSSGVQTWLGQLIAPITPQLDQFVDVPIGELQLNLPVFVPVASGLLAAGTNQATATLLPGLVNIINGGTPGGGFVLPEVTTTPGITVINRWSSAPLIYPPQGFAFENLAVNAPLELAPNIGSSVYVLASESSTFVVM